MMMKIAIAMEERSSDLHRLAYSAIKAANSHEDDRCFDILRLMKQSLSPSVKDLCDSNAIPPLASLRDHQNPKLRIEANLLFNSWMKSLFYSSGHNSSTCNKAPSRSKAHETGMIKHKPEENSKSVAARSLPMKLSENPRSTKAHETGKIKHKPRVFNSVLPTSRTTTLQMKKKQAHLKDSQNLKQCPALKKNSTEMLELFDVAKKSADVANAKELLAAKAEASICVDTLSLLMDFSISATAPETRRIMLRLESLTKHKDRKICNSASALLHCWRQNIKDQQH